MTKNTNHKPLKLYTKTGDQGESGLINGQRQPKDSAVFEALGTVDELNAALGFSVIVVKSTSLRQELQHIQHTLIKVGAVIAGSHDQKNQIAPKDTEFLEQRIDEYQGKLGNNWFQKFPLPGGVELAARLDMARTVARRAERRVVTFARQEKISNLIPQYLNRISDYLFSLRCWVNFESRYQETQF